MSDGNPSDPRAEIKGNKFEDLTGRPYGRLTVEALVGLVAVGAKAGRVTVWRCRCECGNVRDVRRGLLIEGRVYACGPCMKLERSRRNTTHGQSRSPLYAVWRSMIARCENPNDAEFHNYGGRGVRVCRRWRDSFEAFAKDMGKRPSAAHSLDRFPDQDGDYEPGNVRWATKKQQRRNSRDCRVIEFKGQKQAVADWAEEFGLRSETINRRLAAGWSPERALTTPSRRKGG